VIYGRILLFLAKFVKPSIPLITKEEKALLSSSWLREVSAAKLVDS
jgi:hypothetical protein